MKKKAISVYCSLIGLLFTNGEGEEQGADFMGSRKDGKGKKITHSKQKKRMSRPRKHQGTGRGNVRGKGRRERKCKIRREKEREIDRHGWESN